VTSRQQRARDRMRAMSRATRRANGYKERRQREPRRLVGDAERFEVATWLLFRECGAGVYEAGRLTLILVGPSTIEDVAAVEGGLLRVSAEPNKPRQSDNNFYSEKIRDKAERAASRRDPRDIDWLAHSITCLEFVIKCHVEANTREMPFFIESLIGLGWKNKLQELLTRLDRISKSNLAPCAGPLSRAVEALLARLNSRSALNHLDQSLNR
jgi:hypothetical protein